MDRRAFLTLSAKPARPSKTAGGGGGAPAGGYLRLATATAAVPRPGGRRGVMTVETGIDVHDAALFARAQQSQPRLNAAYAAVIQREAAQLRPGFPPDVTRIARALQVATDAALGRAGARLLIGTVMVV